jgi:chromosome segregation ATPase
LKDLAVAGKNRLKYPSGEFTVTENVENLILEQLRLIRGDTANIKADVSEVKMPLTSLKERLTLVERGIANLHGDLAIVQLRLDRQGDRIERIEKRLDLTAA